MLEEGLRYFKGALVLELEPTRSASNPHTSI